MVSFICMPLARGRIVRLSQSPVREMLRNELPQHQRRHPKLRGAALSLTSHTALRRPLLLAWLRTYSSLRCIPPRRAARATMTCRHQQDGQRSRRRRFFSWHQGAVSRAVHDRAGPAAGACFGSLSVGVGRAELWGPAACAGSSLLAGPGRRFLRATRLRENELGRIPLVGDCTS